MRDIALALGCACVAVALVISLADYEWSVTRDSVKQPLATPGKKTGSTKETLPRVLPLAGGALLDGFEGPEHTVWSFDSADDEGASEYVTEEVTQGQKALRITLPGQGAKGKLHLRREVELDLSQATALLVDITSPAANLSAALALKSSPGDIYQEIKPVSLKAGLNARVRFPLDKDIWKNAKTNWEYNGLPVNLKTVFRLILLLNTGEESSGSFVVDNLRVEGEAIQGPRDGGIVYRAWRPEIVTLSPLPEAVPEFTTVELVVAFRASYRDPFDLSDIRVGMRVNTPSGKALNATGFFAGLYRARSGVFQKDETAAPRPVWGPFEPFKAEPAEEAATAKNDKATDDTGKDVTGSTLPQDVLPAWIVRFTPRETGRYTLQLYIRNRAGETRVGEHALVVASEQLDEELPGRQGGNVRVCRRDPRHFELQNGKPFFLIGQNVCWTNDWDAYLDKMKAYGANTCRIWLCPWGLNLEPQMKPGAFDLDEAKRIDALMAKAEATGVRIIFCLTFHGMTGDEWYRSPYNQDNGGPCARPEEFFTDRQAKRQFKRLLSYAAARWGASPALLSWELFNEINLARFDDPEDAGAWVREMAGYLKGVDVHRHLVTVSISHPGFLPDLWGDPRIDFVSVHGYGPDVGALVTRSLKPYLPLRKPVLLGEFGGGWKASHDIPDKNGARLQAALWHTACSPACGLALPWWWDTYIEARGLYPVLAAASRFVSGEDRRGRFQEQVRKRLGDGAEVWGVMDVNGARLYVHNPEWTRRPDSRGSRLLAKATPLKVHGLMDGEYRIEFWDAQTGKAFAAIEDTASDSVLTVELPKHASEFGVKIERKERTRFELK